MTSNSELRKILKHITFMKMSEDLAKLSYDPKYQVGSLIIKNDWSKINGIGYNGAYSGSPNKRLSLETGGSKFIHAEMNALLNSNLNKKKSKNYTIYVTMTPCSDCSRVIVNQGIRKVIAKDVYPNHGDSLEVFEHSGVEFHYLGDLIKKLYLETSLNKELNETIKNNGNLIELFEKQISVFFEFKEYKTKLENEISKYNINKDNYLDIFYVILYKIL